MHSISNENLLKFNSEGLIPGPKESESDFLVRVNYCENLKSHIRLELKEKIPFVAEDPMDSEVMRAALLESKKNADIAPAWVPLFFSNDKLMPWHGGCAWIFQSDETSPTSAFFQLRTAFKYSTTYLGIYQREELMLHEFCHIGRMKFAEPKFEEMLAYRHSKAFLRRWLGGIFETAKESALFVFIFGSLLLFDMAALMFGGLESYQAMMWTKCIPLLLLLFFLGRLFLRHRQMEKTYENLKKMVGESKARAVLFRLTDAEIIAFGRMTLEQIKTHAATSQELRWHAIQKAYLEN